MGVKPGYKQTEVGVIPEDWSIQSLGLICDVRDGTHESPRFFKKGVPFLTSKNLVDGRLDLKNVSYISENDAAEFNKRSKVDRHDILMSMIGTIGSAALVDCEPDFSIKNVALLKPRKVAPTYLIHLINSPPFQRYLADNLEGGIQKFVSLGTLRQLSIPLPVDVEQRAIAGALGDVDALIGGLELLIAKKRDLKQAAMQQLLTGQTRLPSFHDKWSAVSLGELFSFKNGLNKGKEYFGEGTPIVNYMDVYSQAGLRFAALQGRVTVRENEQKAFDVREGDVLFTRTSETVEEVGMAAVILDRCSETVFSGFLLRARPRDESLCDSFKKYCFGSREVRKQITSRASYTTRALTNGKLLSAVVLQRPPVAEQAAIATVLSDMDAEIEALEKRLAKTRALKQGMMQELLTGRTRMV
jgi:type I restriction enzyme, S subunit